MIRIERYGILLVISSPSGAGKSAIASYLLAHDSALELSISVTTRARRSSETDGIHYHFVSQHEFNQLCAKNALLEWAEVHSHLYGTLRAPVDQALAAGRDVLFDVDWQGGAQLFEKNRSDVVSVFILPPSMGELRNRLERRAEDSSETIEKRLMNAVTEIPHWREYDYVVINDDLDKTCNSIQAILKTERLRRERRYGLADFSDGLIRDDLTGYLRTKVK